ncbi:MAG: class I SAM-dependent methyltransferase [Gammaproteobacteria bacterium]|nr:class I SAM-dependent methyltransferase [Gammaproteobacteria bacterium]
MNTHSSASCELVNTYEVLEHVMGINGLHPHSLDSINTLFQKISDHTKNKKGIVLDVGCGSAYGTYKLSCMLEPDVSVIGIDINKKSISYAQSRYANKNNLSFYVGTLEQFNNEHPGLNIIGILSVSVSMFFLDTQHFYQTANKMLSYGGIFVDAPFVFSSDKNKLKDSFKDKTYQICGCNMQMHTTTELSQFMQTADFNQLDVNENEFELMNMRKLFRDYSAGYLLAKFIKNTLSPPPTFINHSSWYIFKRTLNIFGFFIKNRNKYGATILIGIK